jgi:hypothetical protein
MPNHPFNGDDTRRPTDKELFALYAHYPEINFETQAKSSLQAPPNQPHSSPLSHHEIGDQDSSCFSDSTTYTTPPRQPLIRTMTSPGSDTLSGFFRLVRSCGFEKDCEQNFTKLGCTVVSVSQALYSSPGLARNPSLKPRFLQLCQELWQPIFDASIRCGDHVWHVSRLKSLVAFNVKPTDEFLWSCYRQRAQLVVR